MQAEHEMDELVGANVATFRKALGLRQEDLSSAMVRMGFETWSARQTVQQVEVGVRRLSWDEMFAMSAFLDVSPAALLIRWPWDDTDASVVINGVRTDPDTYLEAWNWDYLEDTAPDLTRRLIARLTKGVKRSWDGSWPRGGAFASARDETLTKRKRFPGPTFASMERRLTLTLVKGPWDTEIRITLHAGEPYTARDEWEAEALAAAEDQGRVVRLKPYQARRMRQTLAARATRS